jgi:integrase
LNLASQLRFKGDINFVKENSPCFRPLTFPPENDFVVSVDRHGNVVSKYRDNVWDFTPFGSKVKFHFADYDEDTASAFKQLMFYVAYSHLFPGKYVSLTAWYFTLQNVFQTCSKYKVHVKDLNRFPKVIEEIGKSFAKNSPSKFRMSIYHLNALKNNEKYIGLGLLSEKNIAIYKQFDPIYKSGQSAYIPNRLWCLLIKNLDSVLDDFEAHEQKLEMLFHYFVKTTLLNEDRGVVTADSSPFNTHSARGKVFYEGEFEDYLEKHGLVGFFEKYVKRPSRDSYKKYMTDQFGALLNGVGLTCHLYILYYSLMRRGEAASLRVDCLKIENDERLGEFFLLAGETTKTDPDSDARWIVPKRVERAIKVAKNLVEWKTRYTAKTDDTPYLFQNMFVWQKKFKVSEARNMKSFENMTFKASHFFKLNQFKITQQDYDEALALTPSLLTKDWFFVGGEWKFSFHQFRRTLAVHFAVNKVSVSTTQLQMKHGTREQQYHYQNNAGKLRLNRVAEQEVVNEYYAEMSNNIASVVFGQTISPHKKSPIKEDVVKFVSDGESKKLLVAQKKGVIGYRKNLLGGCMKQSECKYGGFDSIAHCSGGDGGKPCVDLIIDGKRKQEFKDDLATLKANINNIPEGTPLFKASKAEVKGYENVLNLINDHKGYNDE